MDFLTLEQYAEDLRRKLHLKKLDRPPFAEWENFNKFHGLIYANQKYSDERLQEVACHYDVSFSDIGYIPVDEFDALYWEFVTEVEHLPESMEDWLNWPGEAYLAQRERYDRECALMAGRKIKD